MFCGLATCGCGRQNVALKPNQSFTLARALGDLRESTGPDHVSTQSQLGKVLSSESRVAPATPSSWESTSNPRQVIVICPDAPPELQGPLANECDSNLTKMRRCGDLDALIELNGHLRAENPTLDGFHRRA